MEKGKQQVVMDGKGLSTKYILDYDEISNFEISRMYDDFRGCSEFEMDQWVQDHEQLFTVREFLELFADIQ